MESSGSGRDTARVKSKENVRERSQIRFRAPAWRGAKGQSINRGGIHLRQTTRGRATRWPRRVGAIAVGLTLALGTGACGGDDDEETTEAASAEQVTVLTADTAGGYTWGVSPTPTEETTSVTLQNASFEEHALIFARLGSGYTVDEAYELEGRKGSATEVIQTTGARPGQSVTAKVIKPLDPGEYVLLCPVVGKAGPHYKLGQLAQFAIE
jgi:hypothetical protein